MLHIHLPPFTTGTNQNAPLNKTPQIQVLTGMLYRGAVPEDSGHGDADFGPCDEWLPVVLAELHSDVEAIGEVFANSRLRQS